MSKLCFVSAKILCFLFYFCSLSLFWFSFCTFICSMCRAFCVNTIGIRQNLPRSLFCVFFVICMSFVYCCEKKPWSWFCEIKTRNDIIQEDVTVLIFTRRPLSIESWRLISLKSLSSGKAREWKKKVKNQTSHRSNFVYF